MENFSAVLQTNQNLQKNLTHDCTFCILCKLNFRKFFLKILVVFVLFRFNRKAEEPHNCFGGVVTQSIAPDNLVSPHFIFPFAEREFGFGSWKNKFSTLENSWETPRILLSSVSEHHAENNDSSRLTLYKCVARAASLKPMKGDAR